METTQVFTAVGICTDSSVLPVGLDCIYNERTRSDWQNFRLKSINWSLWCPGGLGTNNESWCPLFMCIMGMHQSTLHHLIVSLLSAMGYGHDIHSLTLSSVTFIAYMAGCHDWMLLMPQQIHGHILPYVKTILISSMQWSIQILTMVKKEHWY